MNETEKDSQITDSSLPASLVSVKLQKLTSALYLITDFLPGQDPLKWRLRDAALAALTNKDMADQVRQLISLLDVALANPGVSQMNFSLLKGEYEALYRRLLGLTDESLESLKQPVAELIAPASPSAVPKNTSSRLSRSAPEVKPKPANNPRREQILKFVKEHGGSSIKDISRILPHVSTKTVQRELADMVQAGVLKREGDRRWSRYELSARG